MDAETVAQETTETTPGLGAAFIEWYSTPETMSAGPVEAFSAGYRSGLTETFSALAAFEARATALEAALRALRESVLAPWIAGGFVCCGCGEWGETRETIKHEACWLSDEAIAALAAGGGGEGR